MSQFYVTFENSEDRFGPADNLQDAIRIARKVAQESEAGEPICIEHEGKNIRQYVLMPNGEITEAVLA